MLERIRRHQRLRTVLFTVFTLAWLVALLAGAQVRTALDERNALLLETVCFTDPASSSMQGQAFNADTHIHQHDPDCLLCIALATPSDEGAVDYRPPLPQAPLGHFAATHSVPVWRAQAPLPARGPPASKV